MKTTVLSFVAVMAGLIASPAFAIDQVILNSGQTVEGTVLNDIPNRYVDIRLVNGDTKRFEKSQVASVERDVPSRKDRETFGNQSLGFVAVDLGGYYNLDNPPNNNVLFDYGVKIGAVTGQMGDTKIAFALSFDRTSTSNTFSYASYNDLNFQMLFTRINNSGFYIGPNVGLAIRTGGLQDVSGNHVGDSITNTSFEAGAGLGYEVFLSDGFAVGPDVRYEHVFGSTAFNLIKFALQGTIHF